MQRMGHWRFSSLVISALLAGNACDEGRYPSKSLVYVCQASAGGSSDRFVRDVIKIVQDTKIIPVPITVEYKAAGGGAMASNYVKARTGNPYYLLNTSGNFVVASLRDPSVPGYESFTPIARLAFDLNSVVVRADSPYQNMGDLIAAAKANPRGISWAGTSVGSQDHLIVVMLQQRTGTQFNFISFSGSGQVTAALLGGHVDVGAMEPQVARPQAEAGLVRILGLVAEKRLDIMPDLPTLKEQGYDVILNMQRGVVAPPGIPDEARDYLIAAFRQFAASKEWKEYAAREGLMDAFLEGDAYGRFLAEESAQWAHLLMEAGIIQ